MRLLILIGFALLGLVGFSNALPSPARQVRAISTHYQDIPTVVRRARATEEQQAKAEPDELEASETAAVVVPYWGYPSYYYPHHVPFVYVG